MRKAVLVTFLVAVTGCATTDPVRLTDPITGEVSVASRWHSGNSHYGDPHFIMALCGPAGFSLSTGTDGFWANDSFGNPRIEIRVGDKHYEGPLETTGGDGDLAMIRKYQNQLLAGIVNREYIAIRVRDWNGELHSQRFGEPSEVISGQFYNVAEACGMNSTS